MNKKLELKNFDLRHLKLNSKGGLVIDWFDLTQKNDLLSVESDSQPHEDLTEMLMELKTIFAESLGLLKGWDFARENNRKNEEKLAEAIRGYNEEVNRCNVTGITITEQGVKISGSLICDYGKVGLASPLIKFIVDEEETEIGLAIQSIVDKLTIEVWKFIYQGKRTSDLFNQKEDKSGLGNSDNNHLKAV